MQGAPRSGPSAASPQRRPDRRPRRNSDSSVLDLEKPITAEELQAREARRKEREKRHRAERDGKEKKPSRRLDIIDQLDHTSLFGGGCTYFALWNIEDAQLTPSQSTTTDPSTPSHPTATERAAAVPPCRRSPRTPSTCPWVVPAR